MSVLATVGEAAVRLGAVVPIAVPEIVIPCPADAHAMVVLVEFTMAQGAVAPITVVVPGVILLAAAVGVAQETDVPLFVRNSPDTSDGSA
jgi:hypothetical protein